MGSATLDASARAPVLAGHFPVASLLRAPKFPVIVQRCACQRSLKSLISCRCGALGTGLGARFFVKFPVKFPVLGNSGAEGANRHSEWRPRENLRKGADMAGFRRPGEPGMLGIQGLNPGTVASIWCGKNHVALAAEKMVVGSVMRQLVSTSESPAPCSVGAFAGSGRQERAPRYGNVSPASATSVNTQV